MPSSTKSRRIIYFNWAIVGGFTLAALSQARVQVVQSGAIIDRARETDRFTVKRVDVAKRGGIFSADGKPLAQDEDTRVLTVEFNKIPRSDAFYMDLSAATGVPASEFAQLAESGLRSREWREPISAAQAKAVQEVKTSWRADGISLTRSGRRNYTLGDSAAGFVGSVRDGQPLGGLELGQNKELGGRNGLKVGLVDRTGAYLPMRLDANTVAREDGESLTLTIDSELQLAAASALKRAVDSNKADQGVALVMDPHTGDILAMANWPSFDPNNMGQLQVPGTRSTDFNPNYMATLEPGSTFKILTLAKGLEEGVVSPHETMYCSGTITVGKRTMGCAIHHGSRAHGRVDPELAIAKSCNVAAATWAMRIGHEKFVHYMEDLGLMTKPDLGLPGVRRGLFNYNEYAKTLQLATLGFGQSVNTTPLSLVSAFSMLANEGVRMNPRLIKKVGTREMPVTEAGRLVSPATAEQLLYYMEAVVESDAGTGKTLRIPGYRLGGKTGTAQKMNRATRSMVGGGYVSNFVGFVPADQPRAVILVMVDNPKAGQYYGGSVAGPAFVEISKAVIRRLAIPPSTGERVKPKLEIGEAAKAEPKKAEKSEAPAQEAADGEAKPDDSADVLPVRRRAELNFRTPLGASGVKAPGVKTRE
ncbi:MAG TPA: penicillin-binding protein 2 [Fimbriimonadaceae bacterium]|nr:penicillin-binding protein 2 [Fimbriimonadaceae bacterium]